MLKNISKLGATLSKEEQKTINGGLATRRCFTNTDCYFSIFGRADTYCGSNNYCQWF